jgi:hypothetical protein
MAMLLNGGAAAARSPQTAPLVAESAYIAADAAFGDEETSEDEDLIAPHPESELSAADLIDEVDKAFALPDGDDQETDNVFRFDWLNHFTRRRLQSREIGTAFARPLWLDDDDA